jgi:ankyrin repeat protein
VETKDNNGKTALYYAIERGNMPMVQYLMDECHADMTVTTNYGQNIFDFIYTTNHRNDFVVHFMASLTKCSNKIAC